MREILLRVAHEFDTPAYIYFWQKIRQRVDQLRSAFAGRVRISYAIKSNPNPTLLRRMKGLVDLLDVSSGGEVQRALEAGWPAESLTFTGPAKRQAELDLAVRSRIGDVVVESCEEAQLLDSICRARNVRQPVLVRLSPRTVPPGFGVTMSGKPTQFGIDEEQMEWALPEIHRFDHIELCGFHAYSGSQCLKAESVVQNLKILVDLFERASRVANIAPKRLVFGAGFGIPYHENDSPLDLDQLVVPSAEVLDSMRSRPGFADTELVLETGRYLVGEAGIYLTRVVRIKQSRGTSIALCDGGMHHHLGAAGHLGSVILRNYRMFPVRLQEAGESEEASFTLVGPLCTTIDTLGRNVKFRGLTAGDLVAIECSGAYGATASPIHFISHPPPREILVDEIGGRWTLHDISQFGLAARG